MLTRPGEGPAQFSLFLPLSHFPWECSSLQLLLTHSLHPQSRPSLGEGTSEEPGGVSASEPDPLPPTPSKAEVSPLGWELPDGRDVSVP